MCKEVCAFACGCLSSLSFVYSLVHLVLSNQDFYTMLFHSKQHVIQHLSFIHYSYIINQSLWIKINIIALQNVVIYSGVNYGCKSYVSRVNLLVLLFFKIKIDVTSICSANNKWFLDAFKGLSSGQRSGCKPGKPRFNAWGKKHYVISSHLSKHWRIELRGTFCAGEVTDITWNWLRCVHIGSDTTVIKRK